MHIYQSSLAQKRLKIFLSFKGILTGLLVRRFGPRKIGFVGATLYSVGLIVSMFATSTVYMQVSYGIISGNIHVCIISSFINMQMISKLFKVYDDVTHAIYMA